MQAYALERFDQRLHAIFLLLNGAEKSELCACAIEVMARTMDLEVAVSGEVIGKKPDADLISDELS
jgi:hypothetical protein